MFRLQGDRLIAFWNFSSVCNYDCFYCFGHDKGNLTELVDVDVIISSLNRTGKKWIVVLVGGEPFLYPNIVDICKILIDNDIKICIETNLSISATVKRFVNEIFPDDVVAVSISSHVSERERRNDFNVFVNNMKLIDDAGFNYFVNYVLHPSLVSRFPSDHKCFKAMGINLRPRIFNGYYEGLQYPEYHNGYERRLMLNADPEAWRNYTFNSTNVICKAGMTLIVIGEKGKVYACAAGRLLGDVENGFDLLRAAEKCHTERCPCYGATLNLVDSDTLEKMKKQFSNPKLIVRMRRNKLANYLLNMVGKRR
jgi:organic radical activating enzyme